MDNQDDRRHQNGHQNGHADATGDYQRRQEDIRRAEALYPMFLELELAVQVETEQRDDPSDIDDADHELAASRAARRAIRAAIRFRQAAEGHLGGVGYCSRPKRPHPEAAE